jgi:hypothetical protein
MKSRVLISSLVIDFLDVDFNSIIIQETIKYQVDRILENFKQEALRDWEVLFSFYCNHTPKILITKNRFGTQAKEKRKEITIHIPIPLKSKVLWGVEMHQHIYKDENHLNHIINNFNTVDVNYKDYDNRTDYMTDCMRMAIKFCLENGFSINGEKIKASM